ncbi:AraC family transcriptional regulator [Sulfidibacter corallicola]|uniref:AraC family transcriptional regulator n=1 Tax=Sulfidibacter corallicola TaxID=2818388 RepID=A0A8A4TJ02_SULCO|nr:AraC family transcriptional regulator [Sulfidibacter corallicola]QTD48778.1 AraC family transcriptional regulator [Sulfidibacter corallicola]
MDVLSDILDLLRFKGCVYYTTLFQGVWGIQVPQFSKVARFHVTMSGDCWVRVDGATEPEKLSPGDMIIVPHGAPHILSNSLDAPIQDLEHAMVESQGVQNGVFTYGSDEGRDQTRLVCGHLEYDTRFDHPLMGELPSYIAVKGTQALEFAWFHQAARLMAYEAQSRRPGHAVLAKKLTEVLFVHAMRVWQEETRLNRGFLAALQDEGIGRSLQAMHSQVAKRWNLQGLAREAGLSRSSFAERFRSCLGVTPMQYLTDWRMQRAKRLLADGSEAVESIAEMVGYDSPAAFCRVFKKTVGLGPGKFRRQYRDE